MTSLSNSAVLIGDSLPMQRLRDLVAVVAPTKLPVLIQGPTGSGKELVAALLHQLSGRSGVFVPFNVCAVGETMFEDALFGHAKGAYTGAVRESLGYLREANGGTVFLDEVSGLALTLQAKLLRAIETGTFRPIGAARDFVSDFRIIAATNEDIAMLADRGQFRADLHHRLSGLVISVPSLEERLEDVPELADSFARRFRPNHPGFSAQAIELLQHTKWPGNVRELKHVVEVACAFSEYKVEATTVRSVLQGRGARQALPVLAIDQGERRELLDLLQRVGWDLAVAAELMGVHRATLYRRMKRLTIRPPRATELRDYRTLSANDNVTTGARLAT